MFLKPSEIFYTQDDITNTFGKKTGHRYTSIGETLDSICEGRCSVKAIPKITVVRRDEKWFTVDNRRLWVFRHLERLGKCTEIEVIEETTIPPRKFTTDNGGTSVSIYKGRDPGGIWHRKPTVYFPKPVIPTVDETGLSDSSISNRDVKREDDVAEKDDDIEENEGHVAEKDKVIQVALAEEESESKTENLKRKADDIIENEGDVAANDEVMQVTLDEKENESKTENLKREADFDVVGEREGGVVEKYEGLQEKSESNTEDIKRKTNVEEIDGDVAKKDEVIEDDTLAEEESKSKTENLKRKADDDGDDYENEDGMAEKDEVIRDALAKGESEGTNENIKRNAEDEDNPHNTTEKRMKISN